MIRLFLAIVSFLAVSVSGLWYGFFGDPIAETAFENAAITPAAPSDEPSVSEDPLVTEEVPVPLLEPVPATQPSSAKPVDQPMAAVPSTETTSLPAPSTPEKSGISVESRPIRFGYRLPPAPRTIDTIVLHSSYNASGGDEYDLEKTIRQYETYGVGAHYIIDRKGAIYRLVEEANIAYHAGASKMTDGRKNVNDFSIGIEMIANENDGYTEKQYAAVNDLIADIKTRYKIKNIVGHGDIAPSRKTDPWKFDWKKLK